MPRQFNPNRLSRNRRKQDRGQAFYASPEWRKFRAQFVQRNRDRGCAICGYPFKPTDRIHVDHIEPVKTHWQLRLAPFNVRLLHQSCHTSHTHHQGKKQPVDANGYPTGWRGDDGAADD